MKKIKFAIKILTKFYFCTFILRKLNDIFGHVAHQKITSSHYNALFNA